MLEVMASYIWPNEGIPFAGIGLPVDDLAKRLGLAVKTWDVDGLGLARGFGFRAESGRVYLLQELEMDVRFYAATGPGVYGDAADLATFGAEALVDEVAASLDLERSDIAFIADESVQQSAATLVARFSADRAKRG
jgi:hypothetical protein